MFFFSLLEVTFNVPPSTMLTSLCDSYMVAKVSVKKWDATNKAWTAPPSTDHVNAVNNTLYSLWKGKKNWEKIFFGNGKLQNLANI